MNYMKKSIISIYIILVTITLISCKKESKISVLEKDYSLINENLIIDFYSNIKDNPYLKESSINSIYLYDEASKDYLPISIVKILKKTNYKYEIEMNLNLPNYDILEMKSAYLIINYVNNKTLKFKIGSVYLLNIVESFDYLILKLNGNYEDNKIKSIDIELKKQIKEEINDVKIIVANANIGNYHININEKEKNVLKIKIENLEQEIYNTGIIIQYTVNKDVRYKAIHNFTFINDYRAKENIYNV